MLLDSVHAPTGNVPKRKLARRVIYMGPWELDKKPLQRLTIESHASII